MRSSAVSKRGLPAQGQSDLMPAVEMTSLSQALFLGPGQRARSAQAEAIVLVRWITTPGFRVWMEKAPSVQPAEQGRNLAPSEEREPAKAGLPLSRDLGWEARGRQASLPGLDTRPGVRLVCCWRSQFRVVDSSRCRAQGMR